MVDSTFRLSYPAVLARLRARLVEPAPGRGDALQGLLEFTRRHPAYRPLLIGDTSALATAARAGIPAVTWSAFLLGGPPA